MNIRGVANNIFAVGYFFALEKGINMEYKLEKCPGCHRLYVTCTEGPAVTCPHCKESEHLMLLTDPKWLKLDTREQNVYKKLSKLDNKIKEADLKAHPEKKPKTPWTPSAIIFVICVIIGTIAFIVYGLIREPHAWIYLVASAACLAPIILFSLIQGSKDKRTAKAELQELLKEQQEYLETLASVQDKKEALRENWLAKQTEKE